MSEAYNPLQLSGFVLGDQWVLRAETAEDMAELAEGLAAYSEKIVSSVTDFKQVALAKGVQTGDSAKGGRAGSGGSGSGTSSGSSSSGFVEGDESTYPKCKHGNMKDLRDKNYRSDFYCPAKTRDEQCKPVKV